MPDIPDSDKTPDKTLSAALDWATSLAKGDKGATDTAIQHAIDLDPDTLAKDLATVVLAVLELLRYLLEGQALNRMEHGSLTEEEIVRLSKALFESKAQIRFLCEQFKISPEEFNVRLGGLGKLLQD